MEEEKIKDKDETPVETEKTDTTEEDDTSSSGSAIDIQESTILLTIIHNN